MTGSKLPDSFSVYIVLGYLDPILRPWQTSFIDGKAQAGRRVLWTIYQGQVPRTQSFGIVIN